MIALCPRHAAVAAALLWLIALPVAWHAIMKPQADPCADPAALDVARFARVASESVVATVTIPDRGGAPTQGKLLTDRNWKAGPLWTIERTWDVSRSYFAPPGMFSFASSEDVDRVHGGGTLPIRVRGGRNARFAHLTVYLYVLGNRPVERPWVGSLRRAFEQLLHGTLPLTVLLAEGDATVENEDPHRALLVEWVRAAWSRYREVCGP